MNAFSFLFSDVTFETVAIQTREQETTYADLSEKIVTVCKKLMQLGVQPSDNVGILAKNSDFWVATYLGIIRYGAIAVPIPIDQTPSIIQNFLTSTDCHICFVDNLNYQRFQTLQIEHFVKPEQLRDIGTDTDIITFETDDNDLAVLMFTSGSTGIPNAVKVSHKNIIANTQSIIEYLHLTKDDRILVVLPFYYCFGTSLLHTHLKVGGTLVLNNSFTYVETVLDDMETYACTGFAGVPSIFLRLAKRSSFFKRDFKHLRYFQQAGGRLSHTIIKEIVKTFPTKDFFVMYGQTEATARLTCLPPGKILEKVNSIGKAIPNVTIKLLDSQNQIVQPGEVGQIVASGENITLGYWHDTPNPRFIDNQLYTGDLATMDEDGYIYIVGRGSDFMKPSGNRISRHQISDILLLHPGIYEVEITAAYDENQGELIKVYIGIGENELTKQEVKRHCLNHLPRFAIPQEIIIMKELPKNQAGKVRKKQLLTYNDERTQLKN